VKHSDLNFSHPDYESGDQTCPEIFGVLFYNFGTTYTNKKSEFMGISIIAGHFISKIHSDKFWATFVKSSIDLI
jgi:hypothetical protein